MPIHCSYIYVPTCIYVPNVTYYVSLPDFQNNYIEGYVEAYKSINLAIWEGKGRKQGSGQPEHQVVCIFTASTVRLSFCLSQTATQTDYFSNYY